MTAPVWVLRYINNHGEKFFFVRFGGEHKNIRLIEHTSQRIGDAATFDTLPEAMAALKLAGDPPNWEAIAKS